MNIRCHLLLAIVSVLLVSEAFAQSVEIPTATAEEVGMSSEQLAKVDSVMEESITQNRIPGGIVMIAKDGRIVHFKAYGKMELSSKRPMETDTIMRFYSMTKSIATAAALMLHEEGKLNVNDPVSMYIPELKNAMVANGENTKPAKREMTIADLMRHTAGYSYGGSGQAAHDKAYARLKTLDTLVTLEAFQKKLDKLPLVFEPGTDWMYGISTDVLGRVIEIASGKTLKKFLQQRLFDPLDMHDTGFHVPKDKVDRFAANYNSDGKGLLTLKDDPRTSRYLYPPPFHGAGGGLVSTARDYMRFLLMIAGHGEFQGKRYLKPETVALMTTNQIPEAAGWVKFGSEVREGVGFGFGFNVRVKMSDWDPVSRLGEYGWGGAASTHYWVSPKDDLAVITLEQVMPYSFITEFKLKGIIYDAIKN